MLRLSGLIILKSPQEMDSSSSEIGYTIGALFALIFSKPFLTEINPRNIDAHCVLLQGSNQSFRNSSSTDTTDTKLFQGAYWLSILPISFSILGFGILTAYKRCQPANFQITENQANLNSGKCNSWKMILLYALITVYMLFYHGNRSIFTFLLFSYAVLGPVKEDFTVGKALFLNGLFWTFYLTGIASMILLTKVIKRTEKHLVIYISKAAGCLIMAVVFILTKDIYGLELTTLVYGLSLGGLIMFIETIAKQQHIVADKLMSKMNFLSIASSMAIFPYMSLTLIHNYDWPGMTFIILGTSLGLLVVCALLVFFPFNLQRELMSLQYQHLRQGQQEDNGEKLHKEIKRLLGSATDPESGYQTTDDEVVFDKKRTKNDYETTDEKVVQTKVKKNRALVI